MSNAKHFSAQSPRAKGTRVAATATTLPNTYFLGDYAVVLEYDSVYDVHVAPDPTNYPNLRIQPGGFDQDRILAALTNAVSPEKFDYVLMYSLPEVPGWINSGGNRSAPLGKNIGRLNQQSGQSWAPPGWTKLRACPHMNSVEFIGDQVPGHPNYGGALTVFHEMFHYWGPNMTHNYTVGPREWQPGDPLAWLGQCCFHWTWNFAEPGMPGIMYSGPTTNCFNAFDLYVMGLMGYDEASEHSYTIYELLDNQRPPPSQTNLYHQLRLDDLIYALSLTGANYFEGDGRRIPDTDPSVANFQVLIVVIKGEDEILTDHHADLLIGMAEDIPDAWSTATWGRSTMKVAVDRRQPSATNEFAITLERWEPGVNLAWPTETNQFYRVYASPDLANWSPIEATIQGDGKMHNYFARPNLYTNQFFRISKSPSP